jgi:hypothetical protein
MSSDKKEMMPQENVARRGFLKAFGLGAGAAAVGVVGDAALTGASAAESQDERKKSRYRETDHVKTFYRTNRY